MASKKKKERGKGVKENREENFRPTFAFALSNDYYFNRKTRGKKKGNYCFGRRFYLANKFNGESPLNRWNFNYLTVFNQLN